jgi:tripartite-type tricarboxylate transporter receptor subunit TctC
MRIPAVFVSVVALLSAAPAFAQNYPTRPVRLIAPFAPGGATDVLARLAAQKLSERWGQSVIVDNRVGAGGHIGAELASRAAPDGYTLVVAGTPHAIGMSLYHKLAYDLAKDLVAINRIATYPSAIVVHPSLPAKNVKELIALAKAKPGALTYASSGPGSNKHLGGELFKLMTGTDILHVAYKGSTGARNDIIGGHVNMMFDEVPSVAPNVLAGQVRALGVTGAKRSSGLSDIPTVSEAGVPGYEHTGWFGIMVPVGTPKPIVDLLNAEMRAMVARPDVKATWEKLGTETMSMTPAESEAFLHAEIDKWTKVVKAANIKLE